MTLRRLLLCHARCCDRRRCRARPATTAPTGGLDTSFAAQMASSWHYAGRPSACRSGSSRATRTGVRLVTQGTVDVAFAYLGDRRLRRAAGAAPPPRRLRPRSRDRRLRRRADDHLGGQRASTRRRTSRSTEAGIWRATLSPEIDGVARQLTADFPVRAADVHIPAPGEPALATETLTMDSKVRKGAIDSMADGRRRDPRPGAPRVVDRRRDRPGTARARAVRDAGVLREPVLRPRGDGAAADRRRVPRPRRLHPRRDLEGLQRPRPRSSTRARPTGSSASCPTASRR